MPTPSGIINNILFFLLIYKLGGDNKPKYHFYCLEIQDLENITLERLSRSIVSIFLNYSMINHAKLMIFYRIKKQIYT